MCYNPININSFTGKDDIMKKSFKALAVLLTVIMAFASVSVAGYAVSESCVPSIVVPGVFQSEVFYYEKGEVVCDEDGKPLSTPFFLDSTLDIVGDAVLNALIPISRLLISQEDKDEMAANAIAEVLGRTLMEKQKCDEYGHFINDVRATKYYDCFADLSEHDQEYIYGQLPLQKYSSIAGEENLYVFSYASFGNMLDTATELYDFIQFVKEDSGSEKVNIVPISQGGSIAVALLQLYEDNGISVSRDINRIVYIVPALDGTLLLGEIYQYGLLDDSYELYSQMFPGLMGSDEWSAYLINIALRIMPNADLNNIIDKAVEVLVSDYIGYSTLMWGLLPHANYAGTEDDPGARAKYLGTDEIGTYTFDLETRKLSPEITDPNFEEDSFVIIRQQADWFHGAQLNRYENIKNAINDGVLVFDIVDYNCALYEICDSWNKVNADGIIQLDSTSMGAYSEGVDVDLPADYVCAESHCTCGNPASHEDPNGIVDACAGLLPETTFYFCNQNHERTASNNIIMYLAAELLTDSNFTSVHSYPDKYPQFNYGRNSKGIMRDLENLENSDYQYNYDAITAGKPAELVDRFDIAIAEAKEALDNTAMDPDEFDAVSDYFYSVREEVINYGTEPAEDDDSSSSFNFEVLLLKIFRALSSFLYRLFEGKGFGQMS